MPDFGDEMAVAVEGECKKTRDDIIRGAWSSLCQAVNRKRIEHKEAKAAVGGATGAAAGGAAAGAGLDADAQATELDLRCDETGIDPQASVAKLRELAGGGGFPDIEPSNITLLGADDPATASALVTFPKGALGQVTALAGSFEQAAGLAASDVDAREEAAYEALTQAHVMGFENVPAHMRPTLLAEITQAVADQGLDVSAVSASTRESGLLAGNVTVSCRCAEEFSKVEKAIEAIAPRWEAASGGLSCAEGMTRADELPLSADELAEQASALANRLIDSGFPSPSVTLARGTGAGESLDPDSFTMRVGYDRPAAARMGLTEEKLNEAIGKWRTGEKAKIAKAGAPAAGSFAEKKMRAVAGADIVTRDPARMSPKGRNLVSENAAKLAAAKAERLANAAKKAI